MTADHVGGDVCGIWCVGWNEGEFEMFGVTQRERAERALRFRPEWLDVVNEPRSERGDFDFDGQFLQLKAYALFPSPHGETRPILMNAGLGGRPGLALRNCDAFFRATGVRARHSRGTQRKLPRSNVPHETLARTPRSTPSAK